jgi:hypothetical protein
VGFRWVFTFFWGTSIFERKEGQKCKQLQKMQKMQRSEVDLRVVDADVVRGGRAVTKV